MRAPTWSSDRIVHSTRTATDTLSPRKDDRQREHEAADFVLRGLAPIPTPQTAGRAPRRSDSTRVRCGVPVPKYRRQGVMRLKWDLRASLSPH